MAAHFPSSVATQVQLFTAVNNTMVVLDADVSVGDTSITVDDASALPASGYLTFVDTDEVIYYGSRSGTVLSSVTRGADGTAAASHLAGVDLEQRWNADYHNVVTLELVAVEQNLSDRLGLSASQILAPAGSNTSPTYSKTGDTNTGMYFTGADAIDFATGGVRALGINSSQQILVPKTSNQLIIGTTNTVTISSTAPAASRTLTIPDPGGAANFLLSGWGQIVSADISASAAIPYSKLTLTGAVLNADLAGSIAYSKLSLTGAILNADLAGSIAYSKLVLTTSIVNGDIANATINLTTKVTGTLPVANGGTGVAASTGSVAVVLSTSPTLVTPILGVAAATSINFGGTALSNYTEGTFTPVLKFGGATTGITYGTQTGRYTRIGRVVEFEIRLILTSKGSATGQATITGAPFNAVDRAYSMGLCNAMAVTIITPLIMEMDTATWFPAYIAAGVLTGMDNTHFTNTSTLSWTGTFSV